MNIRFWFEKLLDLIYRKKCYFCGKSRDSLVMCSDCYDLLEFNDFEPHKIINGVNIYCAGYYNKELQKLIRGLKYHNQRELSFYQAKFMYEYMVNLKDVVDKRFVLIPVPLHKKRQTKRQYNHMELVCEKLSELSGLEYDFELIKRIKDTKPQYKLSRKERLINLSGAFEVIKKDDLDKCLLLVDDICTTGTTFEEMINVLKKAGYKNIVCLATSMPV